MNRKNSWYVLVIYSLFSLGACSSLIAAEDLRAVPSLTKEGGYSIEELKKLVGGANFIVLTDKGGVPIPLITINQSTKQEDAQIAQKGEFNVKDPSYLTDPNNLASVSISILGKGIDLNKITDSTTAKFVLQEDPTHIERLVTMRRLNAHCQEGQAFCADKTRYQQIMLFFVAQVEMKDEHGTIIHPYIKMYLNDPFPGKQVNNRYPAKNILDKYKW